MRCSEIFAVVIWTVCDYRNFHLKLKQWTLNGPDWSNGLLICKREKKDRGSSSQGCVKYIQKYSHDKGYEIGEGQTQTAASVPEKPSGTWLWPRSSQGHCGRNFKKPTKKPYVSQLENTDCHCSPDTSNCCVLCRTPNSVLASVGISSCTWCVLRQRHSLNYPWPPVFFLTTFSQPVT